MSEGVTSEGTSEFVVGRGKVRDSQKGNVVYSGDL